MSRPGLFVALAFSGFIDQGNKFTANSSFHPSVHSLRSKRSPTSRMKSERATEPFRIRAERKMGREQKRSKELLPHFCSRLTSRAAELLSPHFSRGPKAKKLFRVVQFYSARTGTLATQATPYILFQLIRLFHIESAKLQNAH